MEMKQWINPALILLVLLLTFFAYRGALSGEFTNWDDNGYVVENPRVRDFSWRGISRHFHTIEQSLYHPLTMLSYSTEYRLFGLDTFYYHLTNLLLHLANTALVYFLVLLILGGRLPAFLGALIFGLHPVHVEPVAWISGRKELLCAFFYLAGMIAYHKKKPWLVWPAFVLALLSKPIAITFPFVLLLQDYLAERRGWKRAILEKAPFLIVSILFAAVAFTAQKSAGSIGEQRLQDPFQILVMPFWNLGEYILRAFCPANLSAFYSYPEPASARFLFSLGLLALCTCAILLYGRKIRPVVFGTLFFLVLLFPVLKIVPIGAAAAADRYMYLPLLGVIFVILKAAEGFPRISLVLLVAWSAWLGVLAEKQTEIWQNSRVLWESVIEEDPDNIIANNSLAYYLVGKGELEEAAVHFRQVLRVAPWYAKTRMNLGSCLSSLGRYREAEAEYLMIIQKVEADDWILSHTHYNFGLLCSKRDRIREAVRHWKKTLAYKPDFMQAHHSLALAYTRLGETGKAGRHHAEAERLRSLMNPALEKTD